MSITEFEQDLKLSVAVSIVDEIFIEGSMKIKFARQQIFHMLFAKFVCNQMYINSSLWNY